MNSAQELIEELQLQPHPEGGYYRETYRAEVTVQTYGGQQRNVSTAIYFLLEDENFSALHRIKSDELWFFHIGEPLEIVQLRNGQLRTVILGNDIAAGQVPQTIVPANCWFGSRIKSGKGFTLVSCTVAPGFDFADFELAERDKMIADHPSLEQIIRQYTR